MRLTTLKKTETTTAALIDRLYPNLTDAQRKKAETELLKANPHLTDAAAFKPDTVIKLPEAPGLKPKAGQAGDDPVKEMLGQLKTALEGYGKLQSMSLDNELAVIADQEALLKDKELAAALKNSPEATEAAKQLSANLGKRKKEAEVDRKERDALFARMAADVDALFK